VHTRSTAAGVCWQASTKTSMVTYTQQPCCSTCTGPKVDGHSASDLVTAVPCSIIGYLPSPHRPVVLCCRPEQPIDLQAGQTVVLTCDGSKQASSSVLPISYPSLTGTGLQPGRSVFVGQYLFTGELVRSCKHFAHLQHATCSRQPSCSRRTTDSWCSAVDWRHLSSKVRG
jgi:hypothetical protein